MKKLTCLNSPRKHMASYLPLVLAATALTLGACSVLRPKQAVQVSATDVNLNSSWHASIASPPDLAGAVQMSA
jgi:hypothetical protein